MATMIWGGSGIEKVTFDFIISNLPKGSTILEFGAGYSSTLALMPHYKLTSVDHQQKYADINPNGIYAPEKDGWYDLDVLPYGEYDLIILDGLNRREFLKHWKEFTAKYYLIHDTYRKEESDLAIELSKLTGRGLFYFTEGDYFAWLS